MWRAQIKAVIPYERAITYLEAGRRAASPTEKTPLYDRAVGFLTSSSRRSPTTRWPPMRIPREDVSSREGTG
ncbi:MAG: hypothetical protein Ct9H300mP1_37460 [Planctomycetaceae bacterium]|nr:MAG: hypothetical protein Ct9H300mP1_37460 [Planctomycetaceae bacterium]